MPLAPLQKAYEIIEENDDYFSIHYTYLRDEVITTKLIKFYKTYKNYYSICPHSVFNFEPYLVYFDEQDTMDFTTYQDYREFWVKKYKEFGMSIPANLRCHRQVLY